MMMIMVTPAGRFEPFLSHNNRRAGRFPRNLERNATAMCRGFVKLRRDFFTSELWANAKNRPIAEIYLDIVQLADYSDGDGRGTLLTTGRALAKRCGRNEAFVARCLRRLEAEGWLTFMPTANRMNTLIIIEDYDCKSGVNKNFEAVGEAVREAVREADKALEPSELQRVARQSVRQSVRQLVRQYNKNIKNNDEVVNRTCVREADGDGRKTAVKAGREAKPVVPQPAAGGQGKESPAKESAATACTVTGAPHTAADAEAARQAEAEEEAKRLIAKLRADVARLKPDHPTVWTQSLCMRHGLEGPGEVRQRLDEFVWSCIARGQLRHDGETDLKRHIDSWLRERLEDEREKQKQQLETLKPNGTTKQIRTAPWGTFTGGAGGARRYPTSGDASRAVAENARRQLERAERAMPGHAAARGGEAPF